MDWKYLRSLWILVAVTLIADYGHGFDVDLVEQWPKNSTVRLGENGTLHCTLKPRITYKSMNWQFVTSSGLTQVYYGDSTTLKVKEGWTDKLEPAPSSPHDILIKSANWDHAGLYRCGVNDKNADTKEKDATVTVVEKSTCKSGDDNEKEDGQTVFMDCSVKYSSAVLSPYLPDIKWYDETGNEVRGGSYIELNIPDGETVTGDDDGKIFQCMISFTDNDYSDTCKTGFRVLYGAIGVTFDPEYIDTEPPLKRRVGDFINCTASGNPAPTYTWTKLSPYGGGPEIGTGSQLTMTDDMIGSTNVYLCTAQNTFKGRPQSSNLTVIFNVTQLDSDLVKLKATDENGKPTNHLSPGKIVNLNCTYQFDPLAMSFFNGSDMTIFGWHFFTWKGSAGCGFENLVKPVGAGDRWMAIKFEVPYCYNDEVIKCMVVDKLANKHEDKKTFPIGAIHKPSKINGTNCNGIITLKEKHKFQLTCQVFGVGPEVEISWSDQCTENDKVTTEDTEKCFFNQVSTATCTMIEGTEMSVTCLAENVVDKDFCTIMIQEEGVPVMVIVISVIIPLVIVLILVVIVMVWRLRKQAANSEVNAMSCRLAQSPVNTKKDDGGIDNPYHEMFEGQHIPMETNHTDYLTPITDVLDEDHPKDKDAGYRNLVPSETKLRLRPGPLVNMETKSDVLNHLPANVKKEAMEFVLEVDGLHYIQDIGKGHFGKVYLCKLIQETHSCLVAVKSMNGGRFRKLDEVQAFIQEALKIKDFRNDCVLSPLGIVFHQGTPKIILPYMENGDLRGFLAKKMSSSGAFEFVRLVSFCLDVAEGMSYLSRQRFAHMDLAARNCMVDGMFRVKVGDFGMTHDLYEKSYYRMSKSKPLPVRWMAPESITENKFTCKSDVWSYGVVMWEVFTHGDQPYKHLDNHQFLNKIATGKFVRLEQPDLCPEEIYSMMCECWNPDPDGRPRFSVMKAELERVSNAPIINV